MPYFCFNGQCFDLELEKYDSILQFAQFLKRALNGEELIDKYCNRLVLKTDLEKRDFITTIKHDWVFTSMFEGKFTLVERKLIQMIFNYIGD